MTTADYGIPWNLSFVANVTSTPQKVYHYPTYHPGHTEVKVILIAIVAGLLSVVTMVGNLMVMISFKMDKQLQTTSNYFLLSLATADFIVGLISIPLFTVYTVLGSWVLGPIICDTWLSLDYLTSNASVLTLLIICFDQYLPVVCPLTYHKLRTTRRAVFMIVCAWILSMSMWPPWIYSWPYIEGSRLVPEDECYIQLLETSIYITFGTVIASFYFPVAIMITLYWHIWFIRRETEKELKDVTYRQAVKTDSSKRSTSSDVAQVQAGDAATVAIAAEWAKLACSDSATNTADELEASYVQTKRHPDTPIQSSVSQCTSLTLRSDPSSSTAECPTVEQKQDQKIVEQTQDRRGARMEFAISLAFILTWTAYNVLVVYRTLFTCNDECISQEVWDFSYYLCYINSTINPFCYALCSASFRRTYIRILTCKWHV